VTRKTGRSRVRNAYGTLVRGKAIPQLPRPTLKTGEISHIRIRKFASSLVHEA